MMMVKFVLVFVALLQLVVGGKLSPEDQRRSQNSKLLLRNFRVAYLQKGGLATNLSRAMRDEKFANLLGDLKIGSRTPGLNLKATVRKKRLPFLRKLQNQAVVGQLSKMMNKANINSVNNI